MRKRFIIEGEWSGYRSEQRRICHRTVTKYPEKYKELSFIRFTDNTTLDLRIRECKPREKVAEIHGYDSLIEECLRDGVNTVEELKKYSKATP